MRSDEESSNPEQRMLDLPRPDRPSWSSRRAILRAGRPQLCDEGHPCEKQGRNMHDAASVRSEVLNRDDIGVEETHCVVPDSVDDLLFDRCRDRRAFQ